MPCAVGVMADSYNAPAAGPPLSGLQAWWDADDASTFTYTSGVTLSEWRDKSGNARHINVFPNNRPTRNGTMNGRSTVVFGTAHRSRAVSWAMTAPVTSIVVARRTGGSTQMSTLTLSPDGRIYRSTGDGIFMHNAGGFTGGALWGTTTPHIVTAIFNGASSKLGVDGGVYATGTVGTAGWTAGGNVDLAAEGWVGDMAEVLSYNRAITDPERTQIESYLKAKWGTP